MMVLLGWLSGELPAVGGKTSTPGKNTVSVAYPGGRGDIPLATVKRWA